MFHFLDSTFTLKGKIPSKVDYGLEYKQTSDHMGI